MFMDRTRARVVNQIRQKDFQAFEQLLTPALIFQAAVQTGLKIVASPLSIPTLVWLAIGSAFFPALSFANLFPAVLRILEDQPSFASSPLGKTRRRWKGSAKHSPLSQDVKAPPSEEAFVQARKRLPAEFWFNLLVILTIEFERHYASKLCFRGFRVLDIDGTQLSLDDWPALRKHFGTAKNGSSYQRAQARLVMLQFPFVRLPFRYELSPLTEGEIPLARRLTQHLQVDDLVLMDAGFWSYGLFWEIQNRGAYFALRLTQKAKFRTLKKLSANEKLVRWEPATRAARWREFPHSIDLRVIRYRIPGFRAQSIVTNVLDCERMPYEEWTRLSWDADTEGRLMPGLYHRRWEIETTFHELKIEQGMNDLRSRTPQSLQYEVAGHIILYLLVRWLIVEAADKHGMQPLQISFNEALREVMVIRPSLLIATPKWAKVLLSRLLERIASHKVTPRPGRYFPRRKSSSNHRRAKKKRNERRRPNRQA